MQLSSYKKHLLSLPGKVAKAPKRVNVKFHLYQTTIKIEKKPNRTLMY